MDEFEKNLPEAEEENSGGETQNENESEVKTELETELEGIRDMFQAELDKEMNGEENQDILIQELDEIEEEAEESEDEDVGVCECCGERKRDTSFGEDYPYCTECRELMKANPLNPIGIIMAVIVFIAAGFSFGLMAKNSESYIDLLDAQAAYSENRLVDAASVYEQYLSSIADDDNVSMKAVKNTIDIMEKLGYYSDAETYIDTYFSDFELKLPWNKKYVKIKNDYDVLMASSQLINENFGDALNGGDFDYEASIKKIDGFIEDNKKDGKYNQTFLEYAKYLLMLVHEEDDKTQLEQLLKIEEIDEGRYPWIYLTYIMNTYGNLGDIENAKKYFDKCTEINSQELMVYNAYANAIRFSENPDADRILEIARDAAAKASQSSYPTYYRIYAVGYLMKGDSEKALNNMMQYLQNCQQRVEDINLYALCCLAQKDKDGYNEAKQTLETYGYKIGSSVEKYRKGKMTLEQVLLEKGGDV